MNMSATRRYNTCKSQWNHGEKMHGSSHVLLGPCPICGDPTFDYGGGWRCCALYCANSASNPVSSLGPRPDWWPTVNVFIDGNKWCATFLDFDNLQESPAGFGDSPHEAVKALRLMDEQS